MSTQDTTSESELFDKLKREIRGLAGSYVGPERAYELADTLRTHYEQMRKERDRALERFASINSRNLHLDAVIRDREVERNDLRAQLTEQRAVIEAARFFVMPGVVVHPNEWRRRQQMLADALSTLSQEETP